MKKLGKISRLKPIKGAIPATNALNPVAAAPKLHTAWEQESTGDTGAIVAWVPHHVTGEPYRHEFRNQTELEEFKARYFARKKPDFLAEVKYVEYEKDKEGKTVRILRTATAYDATELNEILEGLKAKGIVGIDEDSIVRGKLWAKRGYKPGKAYKEVVKPTGKISTYTYAEKPSSTARIVNDPVTGKPTVVRPMVKVMQQIEKNIWSEDDINEAIGAAYRLDPKLGEKTEAGIRGGIAAIPGALKTVEELKAEREAAAANMLRSMKKMKRIEVDHDTMMTYAMMTPSQRRKMGVVEGAILVCPENIAVEPTDEIPEGTMIPFNEKKGMVSMLDAGRFRGGRVRVNKRTGERIEYVGPCLTPEETAELMKEIEGRIHGIARGLKMPGADQEDLAQIGQLAVLNTIGLYDYRKQYSTTVMRHGKPVGTSQGFMAFVHTVAENAMHRERDTLTGTQGSEARNTAIRSAKKELASLIGSEKERDVIYAKTGSVPTYLPNSTLGQTESILVDLKKVIEELEKKEGLKHVKDETDPTNILKIRLDPTEKPKGFIPSEELAEKRKDFSTMRQDFSRMAAQAASLRAAIEENRQARGGRAYRFTDAEKEEREAGDLPKELYVTREGGDPSKRVSSGYISPLENKQYEDAIPIARAFFEGIRDKLPPATAKVFSREMGLDPKHPPVTKEEKAAHAKEEKSLRRLWEKDEGKRERMSADEKIIAEMFDHARHIITVALGHGDTLTGKTKTFVAEMMGKDRGALENHKPTDYMSYESRVALHQPKESKHEFNLRVHEAIQQYLENRAKVYDRGRKEVAGFDIETRKPTKKEKSGRALPPTIPVKGVKGKPHISLEPHDVFFDTNPKAAHKLGVAYTPISEAAIRPPAATTPTDIEDAARGIRKELKEMLTRRLHRAEYRLRLAEWDGDKKKAARAYKIARETSSRLHAIAASDVPTQKIGGKTVFENKPIGTPRGAPVTARDYSSMTPGHKQPTGAPTLELPAAHKYVDDRRRNMYESYMALRGMKKEKLQHHAEGLKKEIAAWNERVIKPWRDYTETVMQLDHLSEVNEPEEPVEPERRKGQSKEAFKEKKVRHKEAMAQYRANLERTDEIARKNAAMEQTRNDLLRKEEEQRMLLPPEITNAKLAKIKHGRVTKFDPTDPQPPKLHDELSVVEGLIAGWLHKSNYVSNEMLQAAVDMIRHARLRLNAA